MAAARSLRRFAQRLRETLACAGTMPSRVAADVGEVERDRGRPSIRQLGVGDHRRPQIALARIRAGCSRRAGRLTSCSVAGAGGRGDRIMFHGISSVADGWRPDRTGAARG